MGVVYKARQLGLNRLVALKMILAGAQASPQDLKRFRHEAEAVAHLQHPNIVQIYEVGEHDGWPYFSLEFVGDGSLAQKLAGTPLAAPHAAQLVATLSDAMQAAHDRGIIHRDLKPSNILLQRKAPKDVNADSGFRLVEYEPKVTDFGLAKRLDVEKGQTQSGAIVGTPSYMAPEQADAVSGTIGPPCDVYALGALLYELLTGRPPFRADTPLNTVIQVVSQEPVPPRRLLPRIPRDLETICLKALSKSPARRYDSARAMGQDLRRFLGGEPIVARAVGPVEKGWRWCSRNPALAVTSGLAVAALVAVTVIAVAAAARLEVEQRQTAAALADSENSRSRLLEEERHTRELLADSEKIRKELLKTDQGRRDALRLSAGLSLDRGMRLCEEESDPAGLLWMARSLSIAPDDATDLQRVIRLNLGGWSRLQHPLRGPFVHPKAIGVVAFSPDGRTFATGCMDDNARLWDVDTGRVVRSLAHPDGVLDLCFSPDGRLLVTGCTDKKARLWETATGRLKQEFVCEADVDAVAMNPDGQTILTGSRVKAAQVWRVDTGKLLYKLPHEGDVTAVAYSPDGRILFTAGYEWLGRFWNAATGQQLGNPIRANSEVNCAAFSPDGRTLAIGSWAAVQLWDVESRQLRREALSHSNWVRAVAFSPDGRALASACDDGSVRIWDVATGTVLGQRLLHPSEVHAVAFSPDGRQILSGCEDGLARLWMVSPKPREGRLIHGDPIAGAVLSRDGRMLLTGSGRFARLWDVTSGKPIGPSLRHHRSVRAVALSPDGRTVLTGTEDKEARLWDAVTGKQRLAKPITTPAPVTEVAFSPDSRKILTGCEDSAVYIWDAATGELRHTLRPGAQSHAAAYSPDGRTIATAGPERSARLWDIAAGKLREVVLQHPDEVQSMTFSPDGGRLLLTGCRDGQARLWDAATGKRVGPTFRHGNAVTTVAFSFDGRIDSPGQLGRHFKVMGRGDRQSARPSADPGRPGHRGRLQSRRADIVHRRK
jgi:WD40 repeat protein